MGRDSEIDSKRDIKKERTSERKRRMDSKRDSILRQRLIDQEKNQVREMEQKVI